MGSSIYDIREELRPFLSMNPHTIYMDWKDASDKKAQLQILLDQNAMLKREEMLDVLEDLGFKVGQLRKKPKVSDATIAFHQDEEKHAEWKEAHDKALKKPEPSEETWEELEPSVSPFLEDEPPMVVITQEMLDIANRIHALRSDIEAINLEMGDLLQKCAEKGWVIE